MAEYQIAANGRDDQLGHSFLPEFKRFERFALTLPYDITPQEGIENSGTTTFDVPSIYDRVLSISIAAPSVSTGAWIAEKIIDELILTSGGNVLQRISNNYIRFWYQCLSQDQKSKWDKMTSSTEIGEMVYLDLPFAFSQDMSTSLIPWESLQLHVKWSNRVESLVRTGELVLNTRNAIIDSTHYDKTKGMNAYQVMEKYNETKQLIVQTHEQSEAYENSVSTFLEMRGPCKDIWFGLKANADFSAHTSDVVTDDLYVVQPTTAVAGGSWTLGVVSNYPLVDSSAVYNMNGILGPHTLSPSWTDGAGVLGDLIFELTAVDIGAPWGGTIDEWTGTIEVTASGGGWLPGDSVSFTTTDLLSAGFTGGGANPAGELVFTLTAAYLSGSTPAISLGCTQPHQSLGVVRLASLALGQTITSANMKVNDEQFFATQQAKFFNQLIPYWRYTGCPAPGYYYYSFALHPEKYQPSGTCNFSRITNKYLTITNDPYVSTIHVMSNRYNVTEKNVPLFLD